MAFAKFDCVKCCRRCDVHSEKDAAFCFNCGLKVKADCDCTCSSACKACDPKNPIYQSKYSYPHKSVPPAFPDHHSDALRYQTSQKHQLKYSQPPKSVQPAFTGSMSDASAAFKAVLAAMPGGRGCDGCGGVTDERLVINNKCGICGKPY